MASSRAAARARRCPGAHRSLGWFAEAALQTDAASPWLPSSKILCWRRNALPIAAETALMRAERRMS
jgi:hypothetical protein